MGHTVTMHRWTVLIVVTLSFSYMVNCLPGKYYLVETYDDNRGKKHNDYMDDMEEEKYQSKGLNTYNKKPEKPKKEYEKQEKYTTAEPEIDPYEEEPEAQLDAGYKEDEEYEEKALEEEEYNQNEGFEEGTRKRKRRRRRNRNLRM